jgi:hypothetical protein
VKGLRFQRRIRLLPGVHLNLSLSGVGVPAGGRGFHVGRTARGQTYVSAGLPGTGLSVRRYAPFTLAFSEGARHHVTAGVQSWRVDRVPGTRRPARDSFRPAEVSPSCRPPECVGDTNKRSRSR